MNTCQEFTSQCFILKKNMDFLPVWFWFVFPSHILKMVPCVHSQLPWMHFIDFALCTF